MRNKFMGKPYQHDTVKINLQDGCKKWMDKYGVRHCKKEGFIKKLLKILKGWR